MRRLPPPARRFRPDAAPRCSAIGRSAPISANAAAVSSRRSQKPLMRPTCSRCGGRGRGRRPAPSVPTAPATAMVPARRRIAPGGGNHLEEATRAFDPKCFQEHFGESITPVLLFGAGHVGRAVVLALAALPFNLRWIDSRADQFPQYVPQNVVTVCTGAVDR